MIEQGIYFALGCIITALAALLFAPVFWNRALRLTRQRLQLQVPLSLQEIYAERDGIRAQFAVERLGLEREVAIATAGKAADMAEIGRRSMLLTRKDEELTAARAKSTALSDEVARLQRELDQSRSEILQLVLERDAAQAGSTASDGLTEHDSIKAGETSSAAGSMPGSDSVLRKQVVLLEAENKRLREARRLSGDGLVAEANAMRDSIHALGVAVAAMTRQAGGEGASPTRRDATTAAE